MGLATPATGAVSAIRRYGPLIIILVSYLVVGSLFAIYTPPWQAPDEPAHYNYVRQLAGGTWPVIEAGDYDEVYRSQAVSSRFAPDFPIEPLTYEDWQPPLYYMLLTPVFSLTGGALLPLRLTSLFLGLGVIVVTYAVGRRFWPGRHWLVLTAAAFVAFLPQHIAILSSVNNDSLSELIVAILLWLLVNLTFAVRLGTNIAPVHWLATGIVLGLGFLTKATVYIMAPVLALTVVILFWKEWRTMWRNLLLLFIPAGLLGAIWWLRNLLVYEGFDPMATMAHDAVVLGQPRTVEWIASYGLAGTLERFAATTFRSFWGQFGWMGVLMDPRVYQVLLLFTAAVVAGIIWRLAAMRKGAKKQLHEHKRYLPHLILLATFILNVLLYLGYNLTYVQHQGRYLFPALIPIGLAVATGIGAWIRPLARQWPATASVVPVLFAATLLGLNLLALFQFIVPQLTLP